MIRISDPVLTLNHLFGIGTGRLAPPYPERGSDAAPDGLPPCRDGGGPDGPCGG